MDAVYIHTNNQQVLGALIGAYSMKKQSLNPDLFDVKLIRLEETPHLWKREGKSYLRKGRRAIWKNRDLQSFSPLRMAIPQLMDFKHRAVVVDPDVFAVGDILDLLRRDMADKAIMCRLVQSGYKDNGHTFYASSVMLLDNSRLLHWQWDRDIDRMFSGELDYGPWISLLNESPGSIGELGEEWNSFDKLTNQTKLLHTTERATQPWKTGLPVDFDTTTAKSEPQKSVLSKVKSLILGGNFIKQDNSVLPSYLPHPDEQQEALVFGYLKDALLDGSISERILGEAMELNFLRHDAFKVLEKYKYKLGSGERDSGELERFYGIQSLKDVPWERQ